MIYKIFTFVNDVKKHSGHWFVHFEGSRESLAFAPDTDPAPFAVGDKVKITFEVCNVNS